MNKESQSESTKLAVISTDIGYMKKSLESLEHKFDDFANNYTLLKDFEPVKRKVDDLERKVWIAMGALMVISFLSRFITI